MWIVQFFLSTMRSSPGKCPVDVILTPHIHLKIATNLYTHNPCIPYHPLMAATSLSGTLQSIEPPKNDTEPGTFPWPPNSPDRNLDLCLCPDQSELLWCYESNLHNTICSGRSVYIRLSWNIEQTFIDSRWRLLLNLVLPWQFF